MANKRIYYVHRYVRNLVAQQRGYVTPQEVDDALHLASRELFNHYNGETGEYQKGLPMARVSYQLTKTISDALHPFIKEATYRIAPKRVPMRGGLLSFKDLLANMQDGFMALPSDFVHPTSFRVPAAVEEVRIVNDNQLTNRLNSAISGPTAEHPFVAIAVGGYQLYPKNTPEASILYLGLVPEPHYGVKLDAQGAFLLDDEDEPLYDDATSTDHGWRPAQENELLWRALKILGVEGRDAAVQQFATVQAQMGA